MASEAALLRRQGFTELVAKDFETLTVQSTISAINNATVNAIVRRGEDAAPLQKGEVVFSTRDHSRIEILKTDIAQSPKVGDHFQDSEGRFHRIQVSTRTDITYQFQCHVSAAAT